MTLEYKHVLIIEDVWICEAFKSRNLALNHCGPPQALLLLLFLSFSSVWKWSLISLERAANNILMDVRRHTTSRCWFVSTTVSLFLLNWLTVCFKCISVIYFWVDSGIPLQSVREQKDVTNVAPHFAILQSCKRPCFYIIFPSRLSSSVLPVLHPLPSNRTFLWEKQRERVENVSRRFEKPIK